MGGDGVAGEGGGGLSTRAPGGEPLDEEQPGGVGEPLEVDRQVTRSDRDAPRKRATWRPYWCVRTHKGTFHKGLLMNSRPPPPPSASPGGQSRGSSSPPGTRASLAGAGSSSETGASTARSEEH